MNAEDEEFQRIEREAALRGGVVQGSMTLAKMFDGDLWVLASDAVKMTENSYQKGRADERNSWPAEMEAMELQVNILTDALAEQPAQQEPVAWLEPEWGEKICPEVGYEVTMTDDHPRDLCWIPLYAHPPQGKPVAFLERDPSIGRLRVTYEDAVTELNEGVFPLYTSPPAQRQARSADTWVNATTWRGLTDDEIAQGNKESWVTEQAWQSAVWWAEAKLKEKNT